MIDAARDGLWVLLVLLGWMEDPTELVENGASLDPLGKD